MQEHMHRDPAIRSRVDRLFVTCFAALVATAFCFVLRAFVVDDWGREFALSATQKGDGTRLPGDELMAAVGQFNVSPKLANSGVSQNLREKPEVISGLVASGKAWFKFVIEKQADIEEVMALVEKSGIPMNRVILMPEGRNVAELDKVAPWLAERCRDLGVRMSDRLHVRLWGDRRGV
jgi:hypothetical protein